MQVWLGPFEFRLNLNACKVVTIFFKLSSETLVWKPVITLQTLRFKLFCHLHWEKDCWKLILGKSEFWRGKNSSVGVKNYLACCVLHELEWFHLTHANEQQHSRYQHHICWQGGAKCYVCSGHKVIRMVYRLGFSSWYLLPSCMLMFIRVNYLMLKSLPLDLANAHVHKPISHFWTIWQIQIF